MFCFGWQYYLFSEHVMKITAFAALDLIVFVLGILNRSSTLYISCTQHLLLIGVSFSFGGMILAANKHKED